MLGTHSTRQRFRWDFMGASKWFFSFSGLILLIGALAVGVNGLNLGIDFTSGTRLVAELPTKATEQQVRDTIAPLGLSKAKIQKLTGNEFKGQAAFQISTDTVQSGERASIEQALNKQFGDGSYSFETIGPTFGKTVADSAIIAIIASLIVISAYIALRFEWRYAVPVLVALIHDLLITAGVYALLGLEVTTATVAALLTILGYSLYDTIIVFDRVRENVPRMPRAAFSQILNRSMSEVLMRSLATSFCTVLPILALLFFGGETLGDFALALAVGVISGTYSSIFIATPVLMHWKEGEGVWRSRRARIAAANGGEVPPYATAAGGAATEVEVEETKKARGRLTAPEDPERAVSGEEFDEMVRELHGEDGKGDELEGDEPESAVATEQPPVDDAPPESPPAASSGVDALPEDLVLKDEPSSQKTPRRKRNKKHGRR
jgi:SecD/SecF fusion protein